MSMVSLKNKILPLKQQIETRNRWLLNRLENLLPKLMLKADLDMWIVIAKENNEDPVMTSLFPATMMSAPRMTGLIFCLNRESNTVERYNLFSKYGISMKPYYTPIWDKNNETQWECLRRIVDEKKPNNIGLNFSEICALCDGISKTMYDNVIKALDDNAKKVVSAEELCRMWLEARTKEELTAYEGINYIMDSIIDEVFSNDTIHPGVTSTTDLEWIFKDKIKDLGLKLSFWCDVDIQRKGCSNTKMIGEIIMPGDIIRCDVGCEYLGLHTDTQKIVYVLDHEETNAPVGLKKALEQCVLFQNLVCDNIVEGRTGNEVLAKSLKDAEKNGIRADLYSHPIGVHVHGAGPIIGLWDKQDFIPGVGEFTINKETCYALELLTRFYLPEWEQDIEVFAEQLIAYTDNKVVYIGSRQEEMILVK